MENKKLRIGRKAEVVKTTYRCNGCGSNHGQYQYGTRLDQIPFGARGKITRINGEKVTIEIKGNAYTFDPKELQSLQTLIEALPGAERLEKHPVFEMAESMPIAVLDGKVYSVESGINSATEISTLEALDEIYLARNQTQIQNLQASYARQVWSNIGLEEKLGKEGSDIPSKIAAQVFPYLRAEKYDAKIVGTLGLETAQEEKAATPERKIKDNPALEKLTEQTLKELQDLREDLDFETLYDAENQEPRTKKQSKLDILLGRAIPKLVFEGKYALSSAAGSETFLVSKGELHYLTKDQNEEYVVGATLDPSAVEENHRRLVSQEIRKQTLNTRFSKEKISQEISDKLGDLSAFAGLGEYDEGEFGFNKSGGSYFVWIKVPEMAIKSETDGQYYSYRPVKAGFFVGERLRKHGNFSLLENNGHPYVHDKSKNFPEICIAQANIPSSGKDDGEVVAKQLKRIREILMFGYTWEFFDPVHEGQYYQKDYTQYRANLGDLKARGVHIMDKKINIRSRY
ncbi:hypothetical protein KA107_02665 [Candidatus Pacearchaeota archaeon]|nr:hypothetical protein [Candidatus Pacearchaeota archaeon]